MMMRQKFQWLVAALALTVIAGGCEGKGGKTDYLKKAREAAAAQQFQLAKSYLDSIKVQDPKNFDGIREGRKLLREVEFAEQKRTRDWCDSVLKIRQAEFPNLQKDFTFQQNKEYESTGWYVHIRQLQSRNHNRCYLQARVDEKGKFLLTSYYCGGKIGHTRVRLYAPDGSFAETLDVPADGALNYSFSDGELRYETVRFDEQHLNGLLEFLRLHPDDKIKVELLGPKRKYGYALDPTDRIAITGAEALGVLLSDITRLLDEIRLAQAKMNYLVSHDL